jgi:hypothetical protein
VGEERKVIVNKILGWVALPMHWETNMDMKYTLGSQFNESSFHLEQ